MCGVEWASARKKNEEPKCQFKSECDLITV